MAMAAPPHGTPAEGGSPLTPHACSFVPEEYQQLLTPTELAIVVGVVQRVLDGQLSKSAIAQVRSYCAGSCTG